MKSLLILSITCVVCAIPLGAQPAVMTFSSAEAASISIVEIDSLYTDALHTEPELGLFNNRQELFTEAYVSFINNLAAYLNENGFFWPEPTRIFSRIYFSENGSVDYFFLNEMQAGLPANDIDKLIELIASFASDNTLNITGDKPFAQCSPVVYRNVTEKEK